MCGLVGIIKKTTSKKEVDIFSKMLFLDTIRGFDSTGVSYTDKNKHYVYKNTMAGVDFVRTKEFSSLITPGSKYFLGHNRAATRGAVKEENAHPFVHGNIILAHNGTLTSQMDLPQRFDVDSEAICYALSVQDEIETISSLDGAYALTYVNTKENTFNIVRNNMRPLYYIIYDDTFFYSSLKEVLDIALKGANIWGKVEEFPTHELWKIDIDSMKIDKKKIPIKEWRYLPPAIQDKRKIRVTIYEWEPYSKKKSEFGKAFGLEVDRHGNVTNQEVVVNGVRACDLVMEEDTVYEVYVNYNGSYNGKPSLFCSDLQIARFVEISKECEWCGDTKGPFVDHANIGPLCPMCSVDLTRYV